MTKREEGKSHIKAMLIGGSIFGAVGAFLGFMSGFTLEGVSGGFMFGWMIGEIFGLGAVSSPGEE